MEDENQPETGSRYHRHARKLFRPGRRPGIAGLISAFGFVCGAALCLLVLTPLGKLFAAGLTPRDQAMVMVGMAVCFFLWLNRHKFSPCPLCGRGILHRVDIGTIEDRLGRTGHPMFRRNSWTQWYECRFCGYREWDEQADPADPHENPVHRFLRHQGFLPGRDKSRGGR